VQVPSLSADDPLTSDGNGVCFSYTRKSLLPVDRNIKVWKL